jgi:hypothetical protein
MTDHNGEVTELDVLIIDELESEFDQLVQVARKSAGEYPTCEIKAFSKNAVDLYNKLLQD